MERLTRAREALDEEEVRARNRLGELDRRLTQFDADGLQEGHRLVSDADIALERLDGEETQLKDDIRSRVDQRSGVDERVKEAEAALAAAEQVFGELTTTLADLTARRRQIETNLRTHRDRVARLDQEIANVEAESARLAQATQGLGDLDALAAAYASAQTALSDAEAAAHGSEAAHIAARQVLDLARAPLADADKKVQRLETEARTISKLLHGETKNLWPPIIDGVSVAKGYEKALGAALGDELDAPVDPSAPMRWMMPPSSEGDPALPAGVEALSVHVQAPPELARRLAQIGVVTRERGKRAGPPAQKPVSDWSRRKASILRGSWDGFVADAHAPTGAARRLAERARLADIESGGSRARAAARQPGVRNSTLPRRR